MIRLKRCPWCETSDSMRDYHDREWGVPRADDRHHFEHLLLEIFQAGLSWQTILNKRANFQKAFAGFDPEKIACFDETDVERLMNDVGIIRNRRKIEAAIHNTRIFLEIQRTEGSFLNFVNKFRPVERKFYESDGEIPPSTPESEALAVELRKRGFKFVGPTGCYAYMQGVGLVNDHIEGCFRFRQIEDMKTMNQK